MPRSQSRHRVVSTGNCRSWIGVFFFLIFLTNLFSGCLSRQPVSLAGLSSPSFVGRALLNPLRFLKMGLLRWVVSWSALYGGQERTHGALRVAFGMIWEGGGNGFSVWRLNVNVPLPEKCLNAAFALFFLVSFPWWFPLLFTFCFLPLVKATYNPGIDKYDSETD